MGRKVLVSETSFCIVPIIDKELFFSDDPFVLLVYNFSDKEIAWRDYNKCLQEGIPPGVRPDEVEGKYAAFGMPGGGVAIERADNRESAARTEVKAETGLTVLGIRYLFTEGKTILRNSRTKRVVKQFFHEIGKNPSIKYDPKKIEEIENPVHIFLGRTEWEDTAMRNTVRIMRDRMMKDEGRTKTDIKKRGVSFRFDELTPEEVASLKIEEVDEIDGVAIVPVAHIQELEKDLRMIMRREKRIMYLSHAIWINRALTQIEMSGI